MAATFAQPMRTAVRVAARRFLRTYPFEEGYFLAQAREVRAAISMPLVALGGINRLDTVRAALGDGFEFVALGRALLREPDLVRRWQAGDARDGTCTHCNKCVPIIYTGTACVLVAPEARPGHRPAAQTRSGSSDRRSSRRYFAG